MNWDNEGTHTDHARQSLHCTRANLANKAWQPRQRRARCRKQRQPSTVLHANYKKPAQP